MYISMNTLNSTAACSSFDSSVRENIPMNRFVDLSLDENIAAPMNRENTKSPSNTTPINLYDNPFLK
uniref:Uncharacterized protein n=1 Tax=Romanomermis culicivorax TaxID=13658 RepID=A0A915K0M8_ROMCU